jgi:DNA polymerase-3 subunit alpha
MPFVHLRVRSDLSFLQSAARVDQIARAAAADGAPAVALTDVRMHGAWRFQQACAKAGVRPIHGLEVDRHLAVHAIDDVGMHNLIRLSSLDTCTAADLGAHSDGLMAMASSRPWLEALREPFGDRLHVEVQGMGPRVPREVHELAAELGLPTVATHNVRYLVPDDRHAYAALRALDTRGRVSDFLPDADWLHMLSAEEMYEYVLRDHEGLAERTLAYAERCHGALTPELHMPRFPVPVPGWDEEQYLRAEVDARLDIIYGGLRDEQRPDVGGRESYELKVICEMGFAGYFLVVADYIAWAREHGIRVGPGRGSGAGSLVAYALGITALDPIRHGLLFERFLNPERVSLPDFDVDFDDVRRGEVIAYVADKYGHDRVAQICNLGQMKSRAALKDANRVLGMPFALGERLSNSMGASIAGRPMDLVAVIDEEHPRYPDGEPMRALLDSDPEAAAVFELALKMEGLHRQSGVHAAGVLLADVPLTDIAPLMSRDGEDIALSQWDWVDADSMGIVKFDFLGLSTLRVLSDALDNIRAGGHEPPDLQALIDDPTDPETFRLLAAGETVGCFQIETGPMRSLLRQMECSSFEDIGATLALYRPGPMSIGSHIAYAKRKTGQAPADPLHPELADALAPVLDETYGLLVYQEQIMAAAQAVAGYTLGGADLLRRAMGKKDPEKMALEETKLRAGMTERGYSDEAADALWNAIKGNADYSFNKAHSAAYAAITYQTAYLKAHFPAEFMAALLTSVRDDKESTALYLSECRRMGMEVLPPDATLSKAGFSVEDNKIRFGLGAVHGLGDAVVAQITREPIDAATVLDWVANAPPAARNKKTLEALVKSGAFSRLPVTRKALLAAVPQVLDVAKIIGFGRDHGFDLPAMSDVAMPDVEEFTRSEILQLERETLGLYVSDHPLAIMAQDVAEMSTHSIGELGRLADRDRVRIAGLVVILAQKTTKKGGAPWAIATLEDLDGSVEVLLFPKSWTKVSHRIREGSVVAIEGRVSMRDGGVSVMPDEVTVLEPGPATPTAVTLRLPARVITREVALDLFGIASEFPGNSFLEIVAIDGERAQMVKVNGVSASPEFVLQLKKRYGPRTVTLG